MRKKIILAVFVLVFAALSVAWSYSGYGKKVSENTSGTPDGKEVLICRKYSEISKVIAIDSQKKSHKKEVTGWEYDAGTGELILTEDLSDFNSPLFHIEGKPSEPMEFILWNCDLESGPVAVFYNGKLATENREYVISGNQNKTLTMKVSPKDISSISIIWHTPQGTSSISDVSKKERDLYAELEGAWFTENVKKSIAGLTENPVLDFSECIDGNAVAAYAHGAKPKIVMKEITDEERKNMIDAIPVNTYKYRRAANAKKLSREAGFKINLPKKARDYKLVSAMIIDSSLKGEKTKTVEFSYDKGDWFSLDSITIETMNVSGKIESEKIGEIEYPISTETLDFKQSVKKQKAWTIGSWEENGEVVYIPEVICIYTWEEDETLYKIQCTENDAEKIEQFIKGIF